MSIDATTRKAGPFTGNGSTTVFSFEFKVFLETDIAVVVADTDDVEETQTYEVDYTVSLNADQDANPGGEITLSSALTTGYTLVIDSVIPETQPLVLTNMGGFFPQQVNDGFDRVTALVQQQGQKLDRAILIPTTADAGDLTLPTPEANQLLAWNADGDGVVNYDPEELIQVVAYGNTVTDTFDGDGVTTNFTLPSSPGSLGNLRVSIDGVVQVPTDDYIWSGGTILSFTTAPADGTVVYVQFQQGLTEADVGGAAAQAIAAAVAAEGAKDDAEDARDDAEDAREAVLASLATLPALGQFQRFMSKLGNGTEDSAVMLAGDSTGDASTEWFYLLAQALAALYPAITFKHAAWNDTSHDYDAATTVATGSGARICTFYNGSIAGSVASRHAGDYFTAACVTPNPDLIFVSYGHNGSTTAPRQLDYFDALAQRLRASLPEVPVVQIGQNPTLSDETMAAKIAVLRPFASRNGWGFISVHDAFKQAGVALSTLLADEVHPNATGSALWKNTVLASMLASRQAYGGGSIVAPVVLRTWAHPLEFDEWTKTNVTLTHDTVNFETLGRSAQLTCTTAGVAYISLALDSGDDIIALRGKWVTFWVIQRVPVGNDGSSGRIELIDSGGTTTAVGVTQGSGFTLFSVRKKIDAAATTLTAYIYPCATAGVSNTIQVDRAGLSLGLTPVDFLPSRALFTRSLRLIGSGANGIGVFFNSNTTAAGLRTVATLTADPASAWTTDWCSDGFFVKQAGDAYARAQLRQDGVFVGTGAAAPTLRLAARFSDAYGVQAHFVPWSDNTYDSGQTGVAWRRVTAYEYRDGTGNKVLGARVTGFGAMTGTATKTAIATFTANGSAVAPSAAYTQAEAVSVADRLQAVEVALQAAMRRLKAVDDAMRSHGSID